MNTMSTFLLINAHKWDPPSPPAALDYVASELEGVGIDSHIIDISFMEDEELELYLQQHQYQGVCLTIRNLERTAFSKKLHFPLPSIKQLVQLLKKYCTGPIIVGGNGFSILPERILEYIGADYGIYGGGEKSLPPLIEYLFDKKGDLENIPNLVYWKEQTSEPRGKIVHNPAGVCRKNLPAVKRGYVNYQQYFHPGYENFSTFGNIETKRGCPYHCVYCVEPEIKGRTVRVKAPEDVTQEVDWFLKRGIDHLFLTDSEFNTDCEAAIALLEYWKEKEYHHAIHWLTYITPANFSEDLARLLPESGNSGISIDFGHVSDKMLKNLGKSYTKADIERVLDLQEKYDFNFKGSLLLGGPGETRDTVREAIEFFNEVECKITLAVGIRVLPRTPFGKKIQESGALVDNPNLYGKVINNDDLLEPVYYISDELGEDIFEYLSEMICNSQQFFTLAPRFKICTDMHGCFRGVTPVYKTTGALQMEYISPENQEKVCSDS